MRRIRSRAEARTRPAPWLALMLLLSLGLFALGGCETTEGFGRDMQSAGGALEEEAEEAD